MNKAQKIAMIRQYLSGADLSESRCYILEIGEALPPDYRRNFDRVIWVTDDKGEVKKPTGKNDILIQVTSKETVQQVKKLGDYLDNLPDVGKIEPKEVNTSLTRVNDLTSLPRSNDLTSCTRVQDLPQPTPPAAIPPAAIPMQRRTIPNPNYGYRKTHI